MITRKLEKLLVLLSGYQPGEVDQRIRPLRERDLIPSGPRGLNAPDLEPLHAALVLLTMVARRATDAGKTAMRAMDLKAVPRGDCAVTAETALLPVIAAGLVAGSAFLQRVEIFCDGSLAWISIRENGEVKSVLFSNDQNIAKFVADFPRDIRQPRGDVLRPSVRADRRGD